MLPLRPLLAMLVPGSMLRLPAIPAAVSGLVTMAALSKKRRSQCLLCAFVRLAMFFYVSLPDMPGGCEPGACEPTAGPKAFFGWPCAHSLSQAENVDMLEDAPESVPPTLPMEAAV